MEEYNTENTKNGFYKEEFVEDSNITIDGGERIQKATDDNASEDNASEDNMEIGICTSEVIHETEQYVFKKRKEEYLPEFTQQSFSSLQDMNFRVKAGENKTVLERFSDHSQLKREQYIPNNEFDNTHTKNEAEELNKDFMVCKDNIMRKKVELWFDEENIACDNTSEVEMEVFKKFNERNTLDEVDAETKTNNIYLNNNIEIVIEAETINNDTSNDDSDIYVEISEPVSNSSLRHEEDLETEYNDTSNEDSVMDVEICEQISNSSLRYEEDLETESDICENNNIDVDEVENITFQQNETLLKEKVTKDKAIKTEVDSEGLNRISKLYATKENAVLGENTHITDVIDMKNKLIGIYKTMKTDVDLHINDKKNLDADDTTTESIGTDISNTERSDDTDISIETIEDDIESIQIQGEEFDQDKTNSEANKLNTNEDKEEFTGQTDFKLHEINRVYFSTAFDLIEQERAMNSKIESFLERQTAMRLSLPKMDRNSDERKSNILKLQNETKEVLLMETSFLTNVLQAPLIMLLCAYYYKPSTESAGTHGNGHYIFANIARRLQKADNDKEEECKKFARISSLFKSQKYLLKHSYLIKRQYVDYVTAIAMRTYLHEKELTRRAVFQCILLRHIWEKVYGSDDVYKNCVKDFFKSVKHQYFILEKVDLLILSIEKFFSNYDCSTNIGESRFFLDTLLAIHKCQTK
ncbi:uncharacterized protein LOC119672489 isoform X1 [Teleopsis dalmanni]|uniref:uncharacterized protein LOC119672489 isoform X1 n=1 Tax=Teleopsis dalmanni TaxID=139649 RepID=UPI0018CD87FE|nr:uncharacterized protein LOC119672489 isoform X1 [Teleopsis dalmanni]